MLKLSDFDYDLPENLIAQNPIKVRDTSRLCVREKSGKTVDSTFSELSHFIPENSLIVFNNTSVFSSRIIGHLETGGKVELFLLEKPHSRKDRPDRAFCPCIGKPSKKLKPGTKVTLSDGLTADILSKTDDPIGSILEIQFHTNEENLYSWLSTYGLTPLPPYIKRNEHVKNELDVTRYQTVYGRHLGSVAAPTAGLHFTEKVFESLRAKKIDSAYVTLHVGAGTFMPVKSENISEHRMHTESFELTTENVEKILSAKKNGRKIIVTGTTSFRALETLAQRSLERDFGLDGIMDDADKWNTTDLFIRPKTKEETYEPLMSDAIITNFHQPKSTLFMLICALIGYDSARAHYQHAVDHEYRFLSYGDSNLFWLH